MLSGNRFVFVSIKILRDVLIPFYGERGGAKNSKNPTNVTLCHRNNLNWILIVLVCLFFACRLSEVKMKKEKMLPEDSANTTKAIIWHLLTFALIFYILVSMNVNSQKERLIELISKNGGRITTSEAELAGIHRMILKQLADSDEIIRTSRGVYQLPTFQEDDLLDLQNHLVSAVKVFTRHLTKSLIHDLKLFSKFLQPWEFKCD